MEPNLAIITGAGKGIGAATARLAAERGYAVAVNYQSDQKAAESVVDDIKRAGGRAAAYRADTSDEAAVRAMFDAAEREFGPVAGLVNNAAINGGTGKFADLDAVAIKRMFEINVIGLMFCSREAVRRMATDRGGRGGVIVNVSSVGALLGSANERVHYAASKGAVNSFTIGLAKEVIGSGVRVNAVSPGVTRTQMNSQERIDRIGPTNPIGRAAEPGEIAHAILFLLSSESSYVVGANIMVTGGR
ncbi:MAG: SDR family oxidoreductase [Alphaproteobacteria bacterium]|nr:SDR family oxidoreductase [Alphaproteobacteria bacterium]